MTTKCLSSAAGTQAPTSGGAQDSLGTTLDLTTDRLEESHKPCGPQPKLCVANTSPPRPSGSSGWYLFSLLGPAMSCSLLQTLMFWVWGLPRHQEQELAPRHNLKGPLLPFPPLVSGSTWLS